MNRKHVHEEEFPVLSAVMFNFLITPSAIRRWWGAARAIVIPEKGGVWMAAWGDDEDEPDYISAFTMSEYEPPTRIRFTNAKYTAGGEKLPFDADITAEFVVTETPAGCNLKVIQDGFPSEPEADEFYAACEKGWIDTFAGIRKMIETL